MIYTVTINPAIDYVMWLEDFKVGEINKSCMQGVYCGGKGNNVSLVLSQLGIKSVAMGFLAGFTGAFVEKELEKNGIISDYVYLKSGLTRINVKLRAGQETDINCSGPEIDHEAVEELFNKLQNLKSGDTLVLGGTIPKGLPDDIYEKILMSLDGKGIRFVVDAAGNLLLNTLKYRPFLIKPNSQELGELFGVTIKDFAQAELYALKLREMGAENVLVSLGEAGALLAENGGNVLRIAAPKGKTVNTVGAGDSMVAGFLAGYEKTGSLKTALSLGVAAGSATAFTEGVAEGEEIKRLFRLIEKEQKDLF